MPRARSTAATIKAPTTASQSSGYCWLLLSSYFVCSVRVRSMRECT